jgi:hypothetical protein
MGLMSPPRHSEPTGPRDTQCPKCGGPLALRPAHPYPIVVQVLFALSFIVFFLTAEKVKVYPTALGAWIVLQIGLGALLVRGRLRTRKRILQCVRCSEIKEF